MSKQQDELILKHLYFHRKFLLKFLVHNKKQAFRIFVRCTIKFIHCHVKLFPIVKRRPECGDSKSPAGLKMNSYTCNVFYPLHTLLFKAALIFSSV